MPARCDNWDEPLPTPAPAGPDGDDAPSQEPGDFASGTAVVLLAPGVRIERRHIDVQFSRSGGPGGQNVNKVSTRCQLRVPVDALMMPAEAKHRLIMQAGRLLTAAGDLLLDCETHRSQSGNREECFEKLREILVAAMHRPRVRRATKPSKGSVRRRLDEKKRNSERKAGRRRED